MRSHSEKGQLGTDLGHFLVYRENQLKFSQYRHNFHTTRIQIWRSAKLTGGL